MSEQMQGAVIHDFNQQQLFYNDQARAVLTAGVDMVADLVTATIGPGGNTIVLENGIGDPAITKDGVTVAKNINPKSPFHVGANLIKRASKKIADDYGDGTSTAALLTQTVIHTMTDIETQHKKENNNIHLNKNIVFKYLLDLKNEIKSELEKLKINPRDTAQVDVKDVIYTSTNGDEELTNIISEAYEQVNADGLILVEESKSIHTTLEPSLGYMWDKGYISPQFLKDKTSNVLKMSDVYYMLINSKLERFEHIKPVLLEIAEKKASLVIIADDYDSQVLEQLVANSMGGYLNIVCVRSPSFGESRTFNMEDMAAITNATLIGPTTSLNPWDLRFEDLGYSNEVIIKSDSITIIFPELNEEKLILQKKQCLSILEVTGISTWEKDQTEKRYARLNSKTITVKVGGYTDLEVKEKIDRYDDAIKALRVAVNTGVLPGGGISLLKVGLNLKERFKNTVKNIDANKDAAMIIAIALCDASFKKVLENCSLDFDKNLEMFTALYNGNSNLFFSIKDGIPFYTASLKDAKCLDPFMVTTAALDTAISLGISLLSSKGLVLTPYKIDMNDPELSPLQNGPLNF